MTKVVTVAEREAREIRRLEAAGAAVMAGLRAFAIDHDVRFAVFGSFARGDLVPTSDFDVVVDGSLDRQIAARDAAEAICERHGLRPDVYLAGDVSAGLKRRVDRDALILP